MCLHSPFAMKLKEADALSHTALSVFMSQPPRALLLLPKSTQQEFGWLTSHLQRWACRAQPKCEEFYKTETQGPLQSNDLFFLCYIVCNNILNNLLLRMDNLDSFLLCKLFSFKTSVDVIQIWVQTNKNILLVPPPVQNYYSCHCPHALKELDIYMA